MAVPRGVLEYLIAFFSSKLFNDLLIKRSPPSYEVGSLNSIDAENPYVSICGGKPFLNRPGSAEYFLRMTSTNSKSAP